MSYVTTAPERAEEAASAGLTTWLTTTDHKKIGLLYVGTSLVFFLLAASFAMVMRTQTMQPELNVVTPSTYNQLFSMHGTIMVFLFAMPMLIGLANYLVPLMIGARDMAFPRLNALSYWVFLFGGVFLLSSFIFGGALDTGWFSYAPLTEKPYSPHDGVTFWTLALVMLGASSLMGSVNFITTMLKMRAPGMTFTRMPLFALATFINSWLIIAAIPSLTAGVVMLYLDRQYGTTFFRVAGGGDPVIWQHLFWFFGHPEVYILILPVFGIMSEVVPVFSRKPLFGRPAMIVMIGIIGFLGFAVWAHHMFAVGLPSMFNAVMAGTSMLIAVPTGVKIFNWLATMWGGSLRFRTPLLFACGLIALFTIGGLTGVTVAVVPFDWQVTDTFYIVGHLHNVLFAGTLFGVFAGIYYWFPKVTGRLLDDRLGALHFWLTLVGFLLAFMPMYVLGLLGMPRRTYTYAQNPGWATLDFVSAIGAYIIAVSILVFVVNVVRSLRRGRPAGDNPWEAWTLEWATSSPPPAGNFTVLPPIRSDRPLWDLAHPEAATAQSGIGLPILEDTPRLHGDAASHAASPEEAHTTPLPILMALAMLCMAVGLLLKVPLIALVAGIYLLAFAGLWAWMRWPQAETTTLEHERFSYIPAGMLTFLVSEAVLFGSLIYAYIHLRLHAGQWPPPGMPRFHLLLPSINSVILISSGFVAHYALVAFRAGRLDAFRRLMAVTMVMGAVFLGGQAWEYTHVGFGLSSGLLGSTFFTITGLHGAHVTGGLILLAYLLFREWRDRRIGLANPSAGTNGMAPAATYYWHFVDGVWVVIFFVIYLL